MSYRRVSVFWKTTSLTAVCAFALACKADPGGLAVLGHEEHILEFVELTTIGNSIDDELNLPRDLGFNPDRPDELWVVNRTDDSVVIFSETGTKNQSSQKIIDPYAEHFMEEVSSIAFGAPTRFATCHESTNTYNDQVAEGNNFMGPALWSSDLDVFGESNPEAVSYMSDLLGFYADLGSHLDMLHQNPLCMGIAWEKDNVYWVFDGYHSSIVRNDFQEDHGPGYDDHADGLIHSYVEGEVKREPDVPSHMVFDHRTSLLYFADTGNNRIAVLDTTTGTRGANNPDTKMEPYPEYYSVDGAELTTFVKGSDYGIEMPSGVALRDGILYVGDYANGTIHAFSTKNMEEDDSPSGAAIKEGDLIDWLDLELQWGALMGIEFNEAGDLYVVDAKDYRILRIAPLSDD